jgi:hypothetical protein
MKYITRVWGKMQSYNVTAGGKYIHHWDKKDYYLQPG